MSAVGDVAAALVARELAARPCEDRTAFLKQLLAHAAAGLVIVEGDRAAGETVYRLADAMVARGATLFFLFNGDEAMGRPFDPARATRARLQRLEAQEKAQSEARAVSEGVAETVALSRARGSALAQEADGRRTAPYRRQTGLTWLARKGRLTAEQSAIGERYGAAFRRAGAEPAMGSTLVVQPGGGSAGGPSLALILRMGEGRRQAAAQLARFRQRLMRQDDLVAACDLCCGQELTPREAASGDSREAARLEALLKVALDILAQEDRR